MTVKFYDRLLESYFTVKDVLLLERKLIVKDGRKRWAYVCQRYAFSQSYDCNSYDLVFVLRE